ncbi:MAG: ribosome biogenesis GTPase Der [Anaerolineae bacterium]
MPRKPLVALVGRPNVGKSTLFNRLLGERRAIVEDLPGTTRDRQYADVEWTGRVFTMVDTGGLVLSSVDEITAHVREQADLAIEEADVILFLTDIVEGLTPADQDIAQILRRTNKPVLLVANKADNLKREMNLPEFYSLGLGDPLPVSARQGMGTGDILDAVVAALPELPEEEEEPGVLHIAIVGRTNVGKSSLVNRMLGQERVIVSGIPGTTRDAIDTKVRFQGEEVVLIDTAGIRRRGRVEQGVEKYSVLRALKAIARADVVLLIIDGTEGVTAQDAHVAGYVLDEAKPTIVLVNKWDAVEKDTHTFNQYEEYVRQELRFMPWVPVLFISALTGQRVSQVLATALRVDRERQKRLTTNEINDILREATARHAPPSKWGKKLRLYYGTQVSMTPPTFVFFVNDTRLVHFAYSRFLENQIRARYKFEGSPIKLVFRGHDEIEKD